MKIQIIGHSGSGKSTFAKNLQAHYLVPILHIDKIFFNPNWKKRDPSVVESEIRAFMKQNDSWIIDGKYRKIALERYDEADQIFFLDFNRFTCLYRAIKRRIKYNRQVRDTVADGCRERISPDFLWWIIYRGRSRVERRFYKDVIKKYQDKTVILKNQKQVDAYLKTHNIKNNVK